MRRGANLPVAPVALRFASKRWKAAESLALRAATGANPPSHPSHPRFAPPVALDPTESRRKPGVFSCAARDGRRTRFAPTVDSVGRPDYRPLDAILVDPAAA